MHPIISYVLLGVEDGVYSSLVATGAIAIVPSLAFGGEGFCHASGIAGQELSSARSASCGNGHCRGRSLMIWRTKQISSRCITAKSAFFRLFVVITNDGNQPVELSGMKAQLVTANRSKLLPAADEDIAAAARASFGQHESLSHSVSY